MSTPDMQTTVAFLSTCVQCPDHDDYKKLVRAMKYLQKTITLPLTLEADDPYAERHGWDGNNPCR